MRKITHRHEKIPAMQQPNKESTERVFLYTPTADSQRTF